MMHLTKREVTQLGLYFADQCVTHRPEKAPVCKSILKVALHDASLKMAGWPTDLCCQVRLAAQLSQGLLQRFSFRLAVCGNHFSVLALCRGMRLLPIGLT